MSCSEFTERKKNGAILGGLSQNVKHSLFGAIDVSVRMPRGWGKNLTTEQVINAIPFPSGPPYNPVAINTYFASMDAVLQTCSSTSGLITLDSTDLEGYYQTINSNTTIDSPFLLFCGTSFPTSIVTGLDGEHFLIPSSYPIYIGGISYQTIGNGPTAKLSINGVLPGISVGSTYTIGNIQLVFLGGGSPGVNVKYSSECYSNALLDGGVVDEIQNIEIDGGTAENDMQKCNINGEEI